MNARLQSVWASHIVDAWVHLGVHDAVLSPGSRNTPLVLALEALARQGRVTLHTVLDERSAGFYALGLARMRGEAVILSCTSGSAGGHYLPAVIEADASGIPLIVTTADRPPELHGVGAPQTTNQRDLFAGHTRACADPGAPQARHSPRWVRSLASRLHDAATGLNPGPVHLNLPFAKPLWTGQDDTPDAMQSISRTYRGVPCMSDAARDLLLEALEASNHGVILAGPLELSPSQGPRPEALETLRRAVSSISTKRALPVLAEPGSQLRHAAVGHGVAHGELLLRAHPLRSALTPDLIIQLGGYPTSKGTQRWLRTSGARVIQINSVGRWYDPDHVVDAVIAADPAGALGEVASLVGHASSDGESWASQWRRLDQEVTEVVDQAMRNDDLWSGQTARLLCQALPDQSCIHMASSLAVRVVNTCGGTLNEGVDVTANRGVNGIDGTIATWMGQIQCRQQSTSVCLIGDLALLHDAGTMLIRAAEFEGDAARVLVVLDNDGGGIFDHLPTAEHRSAHVPLFVTPPTCDVASLCRAATEQVVVAEDPATLSDAIHQAIERPGLSVIISRFNRELDMTKHRALDEAVVQWASRGGRL